MHIIIKSKVTWMLPTCMRYPKTHTQYFCGCVTLRVCLGKFMTKGPV